MAGTILTGPAVHAQEALFSALSLDSLPAKGNAPAILQQEQPHLGPVQLTLGAYLGGEANDNINMSQNNPQSDTILLAGLNLGLVWPITEQTELNLSSSVGYAKYLAYPSNDQIQIAPGSALTWRISFTDGSLTFFDQFSDTQSVISEASVSGISNLPQIDNTVGLRAEWDPGRWLLAVGYSHDNFFSDGAAYQYLNRASEDFFVRGGRRLAGDTQLGLEASMSLTKYDLALQSNNTSYSLGPYLEWQITHFINASVRGGYTIYAFDASSAGQPAQNLGSYYASVELTQQLTEFVSQTISVVRDISLGLNQGNNYTEQLTASYAVNWAATAHLGLNLNLTYEDGNQPLSIPFNTPFGTFYFSETENYSRVGISPGLTYQFSQKLGGSVIFSHWERTSNFPGDSYQDNSLTVELNYSF